MNKRKSWIFVVFSILTIVGLSVFLVLNNKEENLDYNSNKPTEIYASSFSVDLPPNNTPTFIFILLVYVSKN